MALAELHARRLATVFTVLEAALGRIELVLQDSETNDDDLPPRRLTEIQIRGIRQSIQQIRARIEHATRSFSIRVQKPGVRQALAAELSSLWVVLENARPTRMEGYGRKFSAADRADWEELIDELLRDVEQLRRLALGETTESGPSDFYSV